MLLPIPRKKLKSVSWLNKSLQDILKTCQESDRILSVSAKDDGVHNTQIVVLMLTGEERIHFYDRLSLNVIIPKTFVATGNVLDIITNLNELGYDFTEDDLEIVQGKLQAKETSLGYIGVFGEVIEDVDFCSIALNRLHLYPGLWYGELVGNDVVNTVTWDVIVNGVRYPYSETGLGLDASSPIYTTSFIENWLSVFKGIGHVGELAEVDGRLVPYFKSFNLSDRCYEFEFIPSHNYLSEMPDYDMVRDLSGNPSFKIHPDGRITFALAAFRTECEFPNAKPLAFKPINYDLVGKTSVDIYWDEEDLVTGEKNSDQYISIPIKDITDTSSIKSGYNSGITVESALNYPTFKNFFKQLSRAFNYLPRKHGDVETLVEQTELSTQVSYLGFYPRVLNEIVWGSQQPLSLVETMRQVGSSVVEKLDTIGDITISAISPDDFITQALDFFKPRLEAAGFTVEEISLTPSNNIAGRGLRLTKTARHTVGLITVEPEKWDYIWRPLFGDDYNATFIKTEILGTMVTEEMVKDEIDFIISPMGNETEFYGFIHKPTRITFKANPDPDPAVYDWVAENNGGVPMILETCGTWTKW